MRLRNLLPIWVKRGVVLAEAAAYRVSLAALMPLNHLLARVMAERSVTESVLHLSALVHVPYYTVRILREHGVKADYFAVGDSPWWSKADYRYQPRRLAFVSVLQEMWWLWTVVCRYDIVHAHFMVTVSRTGWEWPLLKRMGRHIVVHFRGCEIRDRELNQRLHPGMNICEECDYHPRICAMPVNQLRRQLAASYGSAWLVTTPDLKDFAPDAVHVPFFVMPQDTTALSETVPRAEGAWKIVHATNHPGIEGSRRIEEAIDQVTARGYPIQYVQLTGVTHARVLAELADADLSIGKMKMGYYANQQVESMVAGVPTITYVRPELMTDALRDSGFIFATLDTLADVLEHYLANPRALAAKRAQARQSILALHDNEAIAREYEALYARLRAGQGAQRSERQWTA
jgi:glycosyltransferase involved in cell wall biosynthesis